MRASSILTDQQARVLRFIQDFRKARQYPPTRAEIASHFGWASANAAEDHLKALQKKGKIRIEPGTARGIFVL